MVLAIMVLYIVSSILFTRHFLIVLKKNYYIRSFNSLPTQGLAQNFIDVKSAS